MTTTLGYAYALAGRAADGRAVLDRLRDSARRAYVQPMDFSLVFAALRSLGLRPKTAAEPGASTTSSP
jgi:hypothetical protein